MKAVKSFQSGAALVLCLLLLGTAEAAAHGAHSHDRDHRHHHPEDMKHQREQIPEDYRIMNRTPMTPHMSSLRRGQELFATHCSSCHGVKGKGDGPLAAAIDTPPASFLDLSHSDIFGPGEKYWIIGKGIPEAGMPGFEDQIGPADRWHLVNYIDFLQRPLRRQTQGHDH